MVGDDAHDRCNGAEADGHAGGVRIAVNGLRAARFEITLLAPENIVSVNARAWTPNRRSTRWRWDLTPETQEFGFTGTFTLVPGHYARRLQLIADTAPPADIRELAVFVTVKPGSRAGFELRHVEVAVP